MHTVMIFSKIDFNCVDNILYIYIEDRSICHLLTTMIKGRTTKTETQKKGKKNKYFFGQGKLKNQVAWS